MMDFACKKVSVREVLQCSFSLTKADIEILYVLVQGNNWLSSSAIESSTKFDRSTVQRSLKRLTTKELCMRRQENSVRGGYNFVYQAIPRAELRNKVLAVFDGFRVKLGQSLSDKAW